MAWSTTQRAVTRSGPGVHTGVVGWVVIAPGEPGSGRRFRLGDGPLIRLEPASARGEGGRTVLVGGAGELATPEHLLAALGGLGVTDVVIAAEGPEVPILDGSAAPWCEALVEAGLVAVPGPDRLVLDRPIRVEAHGGVAEVEPGAEGVVEVVVAFEGGPVGEARWRMGDPGFATAIAPARTFALEREVAALLAAGRGGGATAENTVIWGPRGATGPLRFPDEPVRHKLLDLIGDLALLGRSVAGRIRVTRGSHALHHDLLAALTRSG